MAKNNRHIKKRKQTSNNQQNLVAKWMLLVIVVVVPLISSVTMTADPWDIWKVTVLRIAVTVILAAWLIDALRRGKLAIIRTPVDLPLLLFLSISLVSTLVAHDRIVSLFGQYLRYEGWTTLLCYGLVFWFAIQLFDDQTWRNKVINVWVITAGIMAVYGAFQHFGIDFRSWQKGGPFEVFRSFGTIGNPLGFSAYMVLTLPVAIYRLSVETDKGWRILWTALSCAMVAALFFSFSRAGWVALAISFIIFVPVLLSLLDRVVRWRLVSYGLAASLGLILLLGLLPAGIEGRTALEHGFKIMSDVGQGSSAARLHIWNLTIQEIVKQPVLGHGFDTFKELSSRFLDAEQYRLEPDTLFDRPHSNVLQIAFSTGITGAIAYLWLLLAVLWGLSLAIKRRNDNSFLALALASGVMAYFIAIQFGFTVVSTAPSFWIAAGLLASVGYSSRDSIRVMSWDLRPNVKIALNAFIVMITIMIILSSFRPLAADMYFQKYRAYQDSAGAAESVKGLDRAIFLYPYFSDYYNAKAKALFYLALSGQEGVDERLAFQAIKTFEMSAHKGAQNLQSYLGIAEVYSKLDDPVKSEQYARQALDEYHFSKSGVSLLAQALTKQKKLDEAEQQWAKLLDLSPSDINGYLGLGLVYYLSNSQAGARIQFEKALAIDPGNEQAQKALEALGP